MRPSVQIASYAILAVLAAISPAALAAPVECVVFVRFDATSRTQSDA